MKKFVRMEDEIREYNELVSTIRYWYTNVVCSDDIEKSVEEEIKNLNIIKQADTIEELVDEFVVIKKNGDKIITCNYRNIQVYIERKFEIYGAIWTDKGLIYVAEMNKEGEPELL